MYPILRPRYTTICLFALFIAVGTGLRAQTACSFAPTIQAPASRNIFNLQQERTLADIEATELEKVYPVVHDDRLEVHLNVVLARLQSIFPNDQFRLRVLLLDAPEANAFSVGPDRIYVTTRMIATLKNDDELAALLGHELGHIQMHQNASTVSLLLRAILHVDSVGDRQDILDKFGLMMASLDRDVKTLRKTARILTVQEAISEPAADRFSVYASAAAGFSPSAYVSLVERSAANQDSHGSPLNRFTSAAISNEQRLKELKKALKQLPRSCQGIAPGDPAEFRIWQSAVISYADLAAR